MFHANESATRRFYLHSALPGKNFKATFNFVNYVAELKFLAVGLFGRFEFRKVEHIVYKSDYPFGFFVYSSRKLFYFGSLCVKRNNVVKAFYCGERRFEFVAGVGEKLATHLFAVPYRGYVRKNDCRKSSFQRSYRNGVYLVARKPKFEILVGFSA